MTTNTTNEVTRFMLYIHNSWNRNEAVEIFGEGLGEQIYSMWVYCREHRLGDLVWYSELDGICRQKIVDRANEMFNNDFFK